jgi:hypothetical protein
MSFLWQIIGNEIKWENGDKFIANRDIECFDTVDDLFKKISGNFIWTDGESYEGSYEDSQVSGYGRFVWKDGSSYDGIWHNGERDIFGVHTEKEGIYTGEWKNDKRDGVGCIEYTSGNIIEGEFDNNNFNDKDGMYRFKNGDEYRGEFKDYIFHGKGTFTYKDGRKYVGEWKFGKKHGYGIYYWTDGDIYKGHWVKGKRHGNGIKIKNGMGENVVFHYGKKK